MDGFRIPSTFNGRLSCFIFEDPRLTPSNQHTCLSTLPPKRRRERKNMKTIIWNIKAFLFLWFGGSQPENTVHGFSSPVPTRDHRKFVSNAYKCSGLTTSTTRHLATSNEADKEADEEGPSSPYWFAKVKADASSTGPIESPDVPSPFDAESTPITSPPPPEAPSKAVTEEIIRKKDNPSETAAVDNSSSETDASIPPPDTSTVPLEATAIEVDEVAERGKRAKNDPAEAPASDTDTSPSIPEETQPAVAETVIVTKTKQVETKTTTIIQVEDEKEEEEDDDDKEIPPIVCEPVLEAGEENAGYVAIVFPFRLDTDVGTEELQSRERDRPMFTPAVRADVYNVLRNPTNPTAGAPPLPTSNSNSNNNNNNNNRNSPFQAILVAKQQEGSSAKSGFDTYAFCDRALYETIKEDSSSSNKLKDYTVLGDDEMIQAVASIGQTTPRALAITKAFEAYLSQTAWAWGDKEASEFCVEFLIAFGNELSSRLDVNHRIRSTKLSEEEVAILSKQPFCNYVQPEAMKLFQNKWH